MLSLPQRLTKGGIRMITRRKHYLTVAIASAVIGVLSWVAVKFFKEIMRLDKWISDSFKS